MYKIAGPSRRVSITAAALVIAALVSLSAIAAANAGSISPLDSVKEFFGISSPQTAVLNAPPNEATGPNSAPMEPMPLLGPTTVSYTAMTTITCPAEPVATISPAVAGLTFSQISRGSGVTCNTAGGSITGNGFNGTLATNIAGSKWYKFSITSDASTTFTVSDLSIVSRVSSATGSPNDSVQYSIGGSAPTTVIGSFTPTATAATYAVTPGSPISVGVSQTINIYVIPNNLTASTTTSRVENATSVTVTTTASGTTPTKLAITSISPVAPVAGNGFNVTVQSQDGSSIPTNVSSDTGFSFTTNGSAGSVGGTTTGTITSGTNQIVVSGVTLSAAGTGATLTATRTSGDSLTAGTSSAFNVVSTEPISQATGVNFSSITGTSMTVNWTNGDGANRILVAKSGSAVNGPPVDGTTYSANAAFGSGTQIGTGNFVVFSGSGSSVNVTGLIAGTTYHFAVYEFNGSAGTENYLTPSTAIANQATLAPTYTWIPTSGTGSWTVAGNWTPSRTTPTTSDILQFTNGGSVTVNNVASQTIGELIVSGNTTVDLQGTTGATLTVAGGADANDLSVAAGSSLNDSGANTFTIAVGTGAKGSISGSMTFTNSVISLTSADASGITFNNGATFTQGVGCTGNVFGSGTSNSVVFGTGSTFVQQAGSNPFQKTQPASVVVFQTGSLFSMQQNTAPSLAGRTYANLEINSPLFSQSATGAVALSIDNLTITAGVLNLNLTGGINIKGDISVAAGQTLTFTPASANTITLNGPSAQAISGGGTLTFGPNAALAVNNTNGISLSRNVSVSSLTLTSGNFTTAANTLSIVSGGSVSRTSGHVIGNLQKTFTAAGTKNFEVGTANGYSPVSVNATSITATPTFTAKAIEGAMPSVGGPNKLARYWTLASPGTLTADLTFTYLPADITGSVANYQFVKYDGMFLSLLAPTGTPTTTTATVSGVSTFSDWTLAEPSSVFKSITSSASANGSINPVGVIQVNYGGNQAYTITPNANFHVLDVLVDGGSVGAVTNYTFTNVMADHTIVVSFAADPTPTPSPSPSPSPTPLSGNYNVGAGGDYTTLTGAVSALNTLGVSGPVTFTLTDAAYSGGETFPITINAFAGASSTNTLTIKPGTAVTAAITGSSTAAILKLNGADFVTIDGSNSGGTDRSLSITNSSTSTSAAVVWIASATASDGANSNTIKNCVVRGGSTATGAAINIGATSAVQTAALTQNNNNTVQNNLIAKALFGVWAGGTSLSVLDQGLNISGNTVGTATAGDGFSNAGIRVSFTQNGTIDRNDVQNLSGAAFEFSGINLVDSRGTTVSANKVHGMTSGAVVFGINSRAASFATAGTPSANTYVNNAVYDIRSTYSGLNWTLSGINNFGGYGDKYYFNSVWLTGQLNNNGTGDSAAAFSIGTKITLATSTSGGFDIRNNVFSSTGSLPSFNAKQFAHFTTIASYAGSIINNNDLYVSGLADIARFYSNTDTTSYYHTLAQWQAARGVDANSISADPLFTSSTDLHISTASPLLGAAAAGSGFTTDIDGETRNTVPDIGADEIVSFTIGGTVSGLAGSGFVIKNNGGDNLSIPAGATSFQFATTLLDGAPYLVTVNTQPGGPTQNCTIANPSGNVSGANVTNIAITCTTNTYTVGGTVSGLSGTGLVLQNNGGNNLPISANGGFTFTAPVASGQPYAVSVLTHPSGLSQTCTVTNGGGTVGGANITNVLVACTTNTYTVGGSVSGLTGSGFKLKLNSGLETLSIPANATSFVFASNIASGGSYTINIDTPPSSPSQTCLITNGSGPITNANITNVSVACTTNNYAVGGSITNLLGSGLVLKNNSNNATVSPAANDASYAFPPIPSGSPYSISVLTQPTSPEQICSVTGAIGTVTNADITNANVSCVTVQHELTVVKSGTGNGTVTSTPSGINCGGTCSANFDSGTPVTLHAMQNGTSTFDGWSGSGCSGTGDCVVTMDTVHSVTATFNTIQYPLNITLAGTGMGSVTSTPPGISCPSTCTKSYDTGTPVMLTAMQGVGSTFTGWSGDCSGTGTCMVTMDAIKNVTATFDFNDATFSSGNNNHLAAGSYHNISISNCGTVAILDGNISVTGTLAVNTCAVFNTNGFVVSGPGAFVMGDDSYLTIGSPDGITSGTTLAGTIQTTGGRTYDSGASYSYIGTTNQAVGNGLPASVRNLGVSNTGIAPNNRVTGNPGQSAYGDFHISSGVYESHSSFANVFIDPLGTLELTDDITVSSNWTNTGTFIPHTFGVTFNGGSGQTITGITAFYNLTKTVASAQTLSFAAGSNTTVTNALTLDGTAGNLLSLRSTVNATPWNLNASATQSVNYVDAKDSDASSGALVTAFNSVNSGGNTNWLFFVPTPTATSTSTSTPTSTPTFTPTPTTYTITVIQTANGVISPGTSIVNAGSNKTFNIVPDPGYDVATLVVDGVPVAPVSPYTFTAVSANHTLTATYSPATCRVISIPDLISQTGVEVSVPVNTTDVTGGNIISAEFKVAYNPAVVTPIAGADNVVVTPGPVLPPDATINIHRVAGYIEFAISGTTPFSGNGALVNIHMNVIGTAGGPTGFTALTLTSIDPMYPNIIYNGGTSCATATSGSLTIDNIPTTTMVSTSPLTTSVYGNNVTLTATISPVSTGGTVQFSDNGNPIGAPQAVVGGVAAYSTTTLFVTGSAHSITADYAGFAPYAGSSGSTSITITPRPITVTAATDNRVYNGTASSTGIPTVTLGTLVNGDTGNFTQVFDTRHVGTGKTLTASGSVNDGNGGNNYSVTFVTNTTGVITAKAIDVTAVTDSREYNGTTSSTGIPTVSPALAGGDTNGFTQAFGNRNVGTSKTIIPSGVALDGNGGNNYAVTFHNNTTGVITAKAIDVTAVTDTRQYNGTTSSAGMPTISPALVGGDTSGFTQSFDTRNVGTSKTLTPSGVALDGNSGSNYAVTFHNDTTGVITAKAIDVTAVSDTREYNGTTSSAGVPTISPGLGTGDTSGFTQSFDTKYVGTGKTLTPSGVVLDGNGGSNYLVMFHNDTTGVITARAITVTAVTDTREYNGTTSSAGIPTISPALFGGDTGLFTQSFDTRHAGTGKTLTPSGVVNDGNSGNNYAVSFVANITGVITAKAITVTAVTDTREYNGTTSSAGVPTILPALVSGDTSGFTQAFDTKHVGTSKTLTPSGVAIDGNSGNNYAVTFVANNTGVITARAITVTAVTDNRVYNGSTSSAGMPTISPALVGGDTSGFTQSFDTKHVGTGKTLTASGVALDGNGGNNYAVTFVANTAGVITALSVDVTAVTDTRVYNGTASSAGNPTIAPGLVGTDTSGFTQTFDNRNVGTLKTLTPSGVALDGNGGNNYAVTFHNNTTGVITAKPITVTAVTDTREYNGTTSSAGIPTISPALVGGDTSGFTQTFDNRNVGTGKTLTPSGSVNDGNSGSNYAVTFVTNITGVITAKAITVSAVTDTREYNGTTSSAGIPTILPALVGGDTSGFTQSFDTKHVGAGKTLTASGTTIDGNGGNNYAVTFVANTTGVITAKAITVTAVTDTRVYNGTMTSAGVPTISPALVGGDTSGFTQAFDTKHVGTGKTLTASGTAIDGNGGNNYVASFVANTTGVITAKAIDVTAVTDTRVYNGNTSSAGVPMISPALVGSDTSGFTQSFDTRHVGTMKTLTPTGVVNDGNSGNNYAVTFHNDTTGVITAKPITVTAVSDTREYNGTTSSAGVPTILPALVGGDTGVFTQSFDNKHVGTGKTLTATGTVNDGNGGSNYAVSFVANTTGVITAKPATWTTDPASKTFGDADPIPLTTGSGIGFLVADGVTVSYARVAGEAASPPTYHITATLSATGALTDYAITNNGAEFTIIARTLTGTVTYANAAVPVVAVPGTTLTSTGAAAPGPAVSDAGGAYQITGFGAGSYTITPTKPSSPVNVYNGIFANDASMVAQHVVHLITLSPTQQAAARVSGGPTITAFDASLIAQYIVGIPNVLNQSGSWKFSPTSTSLIVLPNSVQDFGGTFMGDVSGDWDPTGPARPMELPQPSKDSVNVSLPKVAAAPGSAVSIPMRIDNLAGRGVESYQFNIVYDASVIRPLQIAASIEGTNSEGLSVVSNSPEPGLLKVVVFGAIPVNGDGVYVNLRFNTVAIAGRSTSLDIQEFRLNDGTAPVYAASGRLTLKGGITPGIQGTAADSQGHAIGGVEVTLTSMTGETQTVVADETGRFEFANLTPGQTYTVSIGSTRYRFAVRTVSMANEVIGVEMIAEP